MRTTLLVLLAVFLLTLASAPAPVSAGSPPVGSCPVGFELHHMMHNHGDHHEHHIGLDVDLNGDGSFCVKELRSGHHVHVDNVVQPELN